MTDRSVEIDPRVGFETSAETIAFESQNKGADMQKKKPDKMLGLLEAATALFSEKSFHDVKLEAVAERVGVGKGTIYTYFKSKDELFVQCLIHDAPVIEQKIEDIIGAGESFPQTLEKLIAVKYENIKEKGPLVHQLMTLGPQLKLGEAEYQRLTGRFRKSVARMAVFFQKAIDSGILASHLTAGQMAIIFDKIFELNMTFSFFKEPLMQQDSLCKSILRFFGAREFE